MFNPPGEETEYYLPAGLWTNLWNKNRVIEGPKWVKELVPINEIPIWVRQGTVLILGPTGTGKPDYDYTNNLEVQAYNVGVEGVEHVEVDIPAGKGVEIAGKVRVSKGDKVEVVSGNISIASQAFFRKA